MSFKQKIEKFHKWQRDPGYFSPNHDKMNHCHCCGEDYAGNFCPTCGQRANSGPVDWNSVKTGLMDVWGMGGRSLPRSLWHLLLRPGYFIGDYINGKRQVSFPPVKMLVIVALAAYLLLSWIDPGFSEETVSKPFSDSMSPYEKYQYYFDYFFDYILNHIDWFSLLILSSLIVPTWFVYRYAPVHSHHTLPQGFFIQVFNSTVFILITIFISIINCSDEVSGVLLFSLLFLHMLRTYKQLFGYNWWGTTWRLVVAVATGIAILLCLKVLSGLIVFVLYGDWVVASKNFKKFFLFVMAVVIPLGITHLINKRGAKGPINGT